MYSASSGSDGGTLFQLRNLINRRNVRIDPSDDVNSSEDFLLTIVEGHILAAVMEVFEMTSLDDRPTSALFPDDSSETEPIQARNLLVRHLKEVVKTHVDISFVNPKRTRTPDHIYEYASETLSLGLLWMEFVDSIREGDGSRIFRCWRYFLPIFRVTNRTNYSCEAFTMLAQEKFLLSPRMAHQLKWSRTVNTHGRAGKNISCDLHMEHLNRLCKASLSGLGSNLTDNSVIRVGKSIGRLIPIMQQFDVVNGIPPQCDRHSNRSRKGDIEKVVKQLNETSIVFTKLMRRKHTRFPKFRSNLMRKNSLPTLKDWMSGRFDKLLKYQHAK